MVIIGHVSAKVFFCLLLPYFLYLYSLFPMVSVNFLNIDGKAMLCIFILLVTNILSSGIVLIFSYQNLRLPVQGLV